MELLMIYWIITTMLGTAWLIDGHVQREDYLTVGDILGYTLLSMLFAWAFFIIWALDGIRFKIKKNEKTQE